MAAPWKTRAERGLDTWSLKGGPLLVGPEMSALAAQIIEWANIDVGLKEPLRKRLKAWQKTVVGRMKAEAPDDPETGVSRIQAALKAKAPVISRKRQSIYASFVTDTAYLNRHIYDTYKGKWGKQSRPGWAGIPWVLCQHEDLTLRHSRGSAKFMERPFKAGGSAIDKLVEAAFEEAKASIEGG
jgi:hypothetical protein